MRERLNKLVNLGEQYVSSRESVWAQVETGDLTPEQAAKKDDLLRVAAGNEFEKSVRAATESFEAGVATATRKVFSPEKAAGSQAERQVIVDALDSVGENEDYYNALAQLHREAILAGESSLARIARSDFVALQLKKRVGGQQATAMLDGFRQEAVDQLLEHGNLEDQKAAKAMLTAKNRKKALVVALHHADSRIKSDRR
jgi:hypothetical protein